MILGLRLRGAPSGQQTFLFSFGVCPVFRGNDVHDARFAEVQAPRLIKATWTWA